MLGLARHHFPLGAIRLLLTENFLTSSTFWDVV